MSRNLGVALVMVIVTALAACQSGPTVATPPPTVAPPERPTPNPGNPSETERNTAELVKSTVQIRMLARADNGSTRSLGTGSGTILSADGLILTNAHVAGGDTPGLAVQYGDLSLDDHVDELHILMNEAEDRPPVARYKAEVVAIDGYLDLAVLRIVSTLEGAAVDDLDLPFVPIGNSDDLHIGDPIKIVGYPGVGGETVSVDTDEVAGFLDDDKLGSRGWIKHGGLQSGGNSGGLLADGKGRIVGVPSWGIDARGAFGNARPIHFAMPMIEAATYGTRYSPVALTQLPENAALNVLGWTPSETDNCDSAGRVSSYPTGTKGLQVTFSWANVPEGLDVYRIWFRNLGAAGETIVSKKQDVWDLSASGQCGFFTLGSSVGFPDGDYTMAMFAGPSLDLIMDASVTVGGSGTQPEPEPGPTPTPGTGPGPGPTPTPGTPGPGPSEGVLCSGRITDASTGLGIANAVFIVLAPGTDPNAWANSAPGTPGRVALGRTDADGNYELDTVLMPGEYPFIAAATGYRSFVNALTITGAGRATIPTISLTRSGTL